MKNIGKTIIKILGIIFYFATIYFAFTRMKMDRLIGDIRAFSGAFFIFGIIAIEQSYKKESGYLAISAIEIMIISFHSLSINYVTKAYDVNMGEYLLYSGIFMVLYYIIKLMILQIVEKKKELKQISDISEIVKEEPIKKEARKRDKNEKEIKKDKQIDKINKSKKKARKDKANK